MVDIEKARQVATEQLAKGVPESKLRDAMWNNGYTQGEIDAVFSGKSQAPSFVPMAQQRQEVSSSKGTAVAFAAIIVVIFTVLPFVMPRPGVVVSGEKVTLAEIMAYDTKLQQKVAQEGGLTCDLRLTMEANGETISATGKLYLSGDGKERMEVSMSSSSGVYGSETASIITIENSSGVYTYHEPDYLRTSGYWTRDEESMLDTSESLEDIDYYNQGQVACGSDMCTKFLANYQGTTLTVLVRDDGLTPLSTIESPLESMEVEMSNPVFGPVDEGLFKIPEGESIQEADPYDYLY
jgi:hypothetical protein